MLVSSWWYCVGITLRYGRVVGNMAPRAGFRSLKTCTIPSLLSLLPACHPKSEHSGISASTTLPAAMIPLHSPLEPEVLSVVAWIMVFYLSNIEVTGTIQIGLSRSLHTRRWK